MTHIKSQQRPLISVSMLRHKKCVEASLLIGCWSFKATWLGHCWSALCTLQVAMAMTCYNTHYKIISIHHTLTMHTLLIWFSTAVCTLCLAVHHDNALVTCDYRRCITIENRIIVCLNPWIHFLLSGSMPAHNNNNRFKLIMSFF